MSNLDVKEFQALQSLVRAYQGRESTREDGMLHHARGRVGNYDTKAFARGKMPLKDYRTAQEVQPELKLLFETLFLIAESPERLTQAHLDSLKNDDDRVGMALEKFHRIGGGEVIEALHKAKLVKTIPQKTYPLDSGLHMNVIGGITHYRLHPLLSRLGRMKIEDVAAVVSAAAKKPEDGSRERVMETGPGRGHYTTMEDLRRSMLHDMLKKEKEEEERLKQKYQQQAAFETIKLLQWMEAEQGRLSKALRAALGEKEQEALMQRFAEEQREREKDRKRGWEMGG